MSDGHLHNHDDHAVGTLEPGVSLPVIEEPLDPANQSLADALRVSFRVLKWVMAFLVIVYCLSGLTIVDQNKVMVVERFGKQAPGSPLEPGFHLVFPYPIDVKTPVSTAPQWLTVDTFWLKISDADKTKDLDQLGYRTTGLNPAVDGAVLTGDRAIMHVMLSLQYRVKNANDFVRNVSDPTALLRAVIQESTVAEAGRTTSQDIWMRPGLLADVVRTRAQRQLDDFQSGLTLETVAAEKTHYPLQVKEDFLALPTAENEMRRKIQEANKAAEETLKGAAGPAWEELNRLIEALDQHPDAARRAETLAKIDQQLNEATGEAGRRIKLAEGTRDKIVADAQAASARFTVLLEAYRRNPELVRQRLRQDMISEVFTKGTLRRWLLPSSKSKFIILNTDPQEIRAAEREAIQKKAGRKP